MAKQNEEKQREIRYRKPSSVALHIYNILLRLAPEISGSIHPP